jgi:hypothetical protein
MVRISLKYDTEKKEYKWDILKDKYGKVESPGIITIVTNRGEVTIPTYPEINDMETPVDLRMVYDSEAFGYEQPLPFYSIIDTLWFGYLWWWPKKKRIYNPVRKSWFYFEGDQTVPDSAALDVIQHDIIEYVTKTIPEINASLIAHVEERESVEMEMESVKRQRIL